MNIFLYDKTFEGLLCCVFYAYSRKSFPDKLLLEGDVLPLFTTDTHTVVTGEANSSRVWEAVEKKLTKHACNMITHVWLSEIDQSDELIFRYICKVLNNSDSIENNFGDEDVLQMHAIAKKVSHERLYIVQFVRFQKAADDIFFAPISPRHNALPLAVEHFFDRFSDQKWVIYDIKRKYGYYYDLNTTVEITLDDDHHLLAGKLDEALMAEDEKLFQDLWKGYFKALTIKERINPRLHRQHMPKRFWHLLTEKQ